MTENEYGNCYRVLSIWNQIKMKTSAKHRTKIITLWKKQQLFKVTLKENFKGCSAVKEFPSYRQRLKLAELRQKSCCPLWNDKTEKSQRSPWKFSRRGCWNVFSSSFVAAVTEETSVNDRTDELHGDFSVCPQRQRHYTITPRSLFLFVICWRRWLLLSASHQQIRFKPHLIPDQMIQHERF